MNFSKSLFVVAVMLFGSISFANQFDSAQLQSYDCKLIQPVEKNLFSRTYNGMMGDGVDTAPNSNILVKAFMVPAIDDVGSGFTLEVWDNNAQHEEKFVSLKPNTSTVVKIENFQASDGQSYSVVCNVSVKNK